MKNEMVTFMESLRNEANNTLIDTLVEGLSFALGNTLRSNDELKEATDRVGELVNKLENLLSELGMHSEVELAQSLGGYLRQMIEQGLFSPEFVDGLIYQLKQVQKQIPVKYARLPDFELAEVGLLFDDLYAGLRTAALAMI